MYGLISAPRKNNSESTGDTMTTLFFLLAFLMPMNETEQLPTYVKVDFIPLTREKLESQIGISCDISPKTLTVGDILYINITTQNISEEPLKYERRLNTLGRPNTLARPNTLVSAGLLPNIVTVHRNSSMGLVGASFGYIVEPTAPPAYKLNESTSILQPGDTMTAYARPLLVPTPNQYDRQLWAWNDFGKEERVLLTFSTDLKSVRTEGTGISAVERSDSYSVTIIQELKIKSRPQKELDLIKEWYIKTRGFSSLWRTDSPIATEWREFEEQLTPGTLRNHIRMISTLVEIAQDENKGKRQAMFDEMLEWIDELHPLEKQRLTKQAFEIVRPLQTMLFGNEINVPEEMALFE